MEGEGGEGGVWSEAEDTWGQCWRHLSGLFPLVETLDWISPIFTPPPHPHPPLPATESLLLLQK